MKEEKYLWIHEQRRTAFYTEDKACHKLMICTGKISLGGGGGGGERLQDVH